MSTTMIATPDLHNLVKEAMEGTASKVDISVEAARQLANVGQELPEQTKTASAEPEMPDHVPTEYIYKLAGALDYMIKQADEGTTKIQPGKGPNALEVLESTSTEENIDAGGMGQAKTQIPQSPPMSSSGVAKDAPNAMDDNQDMSHGEQPVDPMMNEKAKAAAMLFEKNKLAMGLPSALAAKKIPKGSDADKDGKTGEPSIVEKKAAALFTRNLQAMGLHKQAEDAINPAQIAAGKTQTGATPPEGASASEESVPSEPSDVTSQKGMISSNQAAIDYKKVKAKADPKKDVGHVVSEPAQTAATDKTLSKALDHTSEAGAKIASDLMKTAAATAILSKLAEEAQEEVKKKGKSKKEKNSQGLATPSGQSGFQAGTTGPTGM